MNSVYLILERFDSNVVKKPQMIIIHFFASVSIKLMMKTKITVVLQRYTIMLKAKVNYKMDDKFSLA